jgi:iron complex transport system permease protein
MKPGAVAVSAIAVAVMALLSLAVGSVWMDPSAALRGILAGGHDLASLILLELRAPRMVLGLVAGATLGLCGAVLQGLLRNPLADPGLLGVSPGAAFGAVMVIFYGYASRSTYAAPLAGMVGALGATGLTFAFGRGGTLSMVLAGAAVSALFGALVSLALNFAPTISQIEITQWLLGSITDKSWLEVRLAGPLAALGWVVLALSARGLDALALGEAQAASLGVDLDRLRLLILVGVALSVGAVTSVCGAIGFLGLVAPHLVRPFVGHQPSRTLLPSALVGAALLLAADIATRLLRYQGNEIRLGVLTSLIGAPFFFWLVARLRRTAP